MVGATSGEGFLVAL